jgi:hypothetical protein
MLVFVLVVVTSLNSVSGAIFPIGWPEKIVFSPDSSKIAFIWSENFDKFALMLVDTPILRRDIFVYWCNVTDIGTKKSVKVDTFGEEYSGYSRVPLDLKFSPDARYLAVFTANYLSLIDLKSKKLSRLSNDKEMVTSFQWLDKDQIGYCVRTIGEDANLPYERIFWQQNITNEPKSRSKIYQESEEKSPILLYWPLEHWSPKGRYVVFLCKPYRDDSCFRLLDVKEGTVKLSFGKPNSYPVCNFCTGFSWKSDESEVFCLAGIVGEGDNQQAYLIHTNTCQVFDCSKDVLQTFGDNIAPTWSTDWTLDGKYIVANDYIGLGGCLIQPRPWKVVTMKEKLDKHFKFDEKYKQYKPHLFLLPMWGWVGVNAVGVDKKYAEDMAAKFAIDYEGQKVVLLFDNQGWWAFSPDGSFAVVIGYGKKLTLRKLDVPHITDLPK